MTAAIGRLVYAIVAGLLMGLVVPLLVFVHMAQDGLPQVLRVSTAAG